MRLGPKVARADDDDEERYSELYDECCGRPSTISRRETLPKTIIHPKMFYELYILFVDVPGGAGAQQWVRPWTPFLLLRSRAH